MEFKLGSGWIVCVFPWSGAICGMALSFKGKKVSSERLDRMMVKGEWIGCAFPWYDAIGGMALFFKGRKVSSEKLDHVMVNSSNG